MMSIERQRELLRRKRRRKRLGKLKEQLAQAKTEKEKERLIILIQRREPFFEPSKK